MARSEQPKREFYLPSMFPRSLVLFTTRPFSKTSSLPHKVAHAYLEATEGKDKKLIWISTDQPAEKVPGIFEEYGYDITPYADRVILVDLVSAGAGLEMPESEGFNIKCVENPNNLTEVAMLFSDVFAPVECDLAVIDSLNGMLSFNSVDAIERFLRFLPVVAHRTNTTTLLTYQRGQYGPELEASLEVCADAALIAEDDAIVVKTRSGVEKIPIPL